MTSRMLQLASRMLQWAETSDIFDGLVINAMQVFINLIKFILIYINLQVATAWETDIVNRKKMAYPMQKTL